MQTLAEEVAKGIESQPWAVPVWSGNLNQGGISLRLCNPDRRNDQLHVWKMPEQHIRYTVAIDPSMGIKTGDPAAIQVVTDWGSQVAEMLLENAGIEEQAAASVWLADFYNEASLAVEVNGFGCTLLDLINMRYRYKNVWCNKRHQEGFMMTAWNREQMVKTIQGGFRMGEPMMHSLRLKQQLNSFTEPRPDSSADDLFVAMGIAVFCHARK